MKNNTLKRIVSTVLCICLLAGTFVVPSFAAKVSYNGSSQYMSSTFGKALVNCVVTGNQKADVLNLAKSQLGYAEGWLAGSGNKDEKVDNLTEYNRWYYGYNKADPWCAIWVSFILRHAGVPKETVPNFSACSKAAKNLSKSDTTYGKGTWHDAYLNGKSDYTPQAGDIVFFSWQSDFVPYRYYVKDGNCNDIGQVNHVGLVLENAASPSDWVKCIEGNSSDKVSIVSQNPRKIVGYFTPDYANNAEENKLGTVNIIEPQNINNAWVYGTGSIKWDEYPNTAYYEYTIREERYVNGEYKVIDNWLCNNVKITDTRIDLSRYNIPGASAWKCWVGAFNTDGILIAESFVYLRIINDSENSELDNNRTGFDESFTGGSFGGITDTIPEDDTPNTSGEGYTTDFDESYFDDLNGEYDDPLPNGGYQVETGNGSSSKPNPSEGLAEPSTPNTNTGFEDWDIIDDRDSTKDPEPSQGTETPSGEKSQDENGSLNESAESTEDETISLLKRIIAMLETLFKFFGLAF